MDEDEHGEARDGPRRDRVERERAGQESGVLEQPQPRVKRALARAVRLLVAREAVGPRRPVEQRVAQPGGRDGARIVHDRDARRARVEPGQFRARAPHVGQRRAQALCEAGVAGQRAVAPDDDAVAAAQPVLPDLPGRAVGVLRVGKDRRQRVLAVAPQRVEELARVADGVALDEVEQRHEAVDRQAAEGRGARDAEQADPRARRLLADLRGEVLEALDHDVAVERALREPRTDGRGAPLADREAHRVGQDGGVHRTLELAPAALRPEARAGLREAHVERIAERCQRDLVAERDADAVAAAARRERARERLRELGARVGIGEARLAHEPRRVAVLDPGLPLLRVRAVLLVEVQLVAARRVADVEVDAALEDPGLVAVALDVRAAESLEDAFRGFLAEVVLAPQEGREAAPGLLRRGAALLGSGRRCRRGTGLLRGEGAERKQRRRQRARDHQPTTSNGHRSGRMITAIVPISSVIGVPTRRKST